MIINDRWQEIASDLMAAISLLTRIPSQPVKGLALRSPSQAAWAFPLVGVLIGLMGGAILLVTGHAGLNSGIQAGFVIAWGAIVTGCLHEDGLADTADGFWGGWDKSQRLDIMTDSRVGTYGALALVFSVLLRWAMLSSLITQGLGFLAVLAAAMVSRGAIVVLMASLPPARTEGLSHGAGQPSMKSVWMATGLAVVPVIGFFGLEVIWVVALTGVAVVGTMAVAKAKIGGQTGDVLGSVQQISEFAVLLAILVFV